MIKALPCFVTWTDQVYNDFGLQKNGGRGQGYKIKKCPGDESVWTEPWMMSAHTTPI